MARALPVKVALRDESLSVMVNVIHGQARSVYFMTKFRDLANTLSFGLMATKTAWSTV